MQLSGKRYVPFAMHNSTNLLVLWLLMIEARNGDLAATSSTGGVREAPRDANRQGERACGQVMRGPASHVGVILLSPPSQPAMGTYARRATTN
jgi:hypothetical protein